MTIFTKCLLMKYKIQFLKNVMKFKLNIQRNIILYVDYIFKNVENKWN